MITFEQIFENEQIKTYIRKADDALRVLGFTEHSFAHVGKVARQARDILLTLGYPERTAELAQIAGYLHDIGNVINRTLQPLSARSATTTRVRPWRWMLWPPR